MLLALDAQARALLDDGTVRQLLVGFRTDQHAAGRSKSLEPSARVDRVADERIGDVTLGSDLANDSLAAVDADAHSRPIWMLRGEVGEAVLQRERGARGAHRMIRLVAAPVEDGDDSVADELLHLAAEAPGQERRSHAPVCVEHRSSLARSPTLREAREADEVAEEHADLLAPLARSRQVEMPEALVTPFALRGETDDQIGGHDQRVPLPPAGMPRALAGDSEIGRA